MSEYFVNSFQIISAEISELRTVTDFLREEIPKNTIKFELEGRMENPLSSISDWVIYADSFSLLFDSKKRENLA